MSNIFDWSRYLTGDRDSPEQDIADWSNENQRRNRAAIGLDANGNPLPASAAAPAAAAPDATDAATGAALATGVQQPSQEPNSTKTPQSLGALMMNLTQYQERAQGFNKALGMGFAAFAQPRDRQMVAGMFDTNMPDPTKIAATQQALASNQQGQDRTNALGMMVRGPQGAQIAQRLNISQDELIARFQADPAGVGNMIQSFAAPTDQMRNIEQLSTLVGGMPGHNQSDLDSVKKAILAGVAGPKAEQMISDQIAFRQKFGHDPSWKDNPDAYNSYIAQQGARTEALSIRGTSENKIEDLESKIDDIKNDPALPGIMKNLIPGQSILSYVTKTDAERNLLQKIKQATSDEYVRGLADPGLGTRKTQQEMTYVGQSLGGVLNASNLSLPDYKAGLGRLQDQLYKTHADIYAQSGNFNGMDPKYAGYVNDVYRPGGALNEGTEGAPTRQPLDDEAKQFWADNVAKGVPKLKLIEHLRNLNYDTTGLK
jgi:hypothetical protein